MLVAEPLVAAALVAYAALGAHLLGTALLLLLRPDSRAVRWHALFSCCIMAWLALQGWFALGFGSPAGLRAYGLVVHMLPAFFMVTGLVDAREIRTTTALIILGAAAATAYWLNPWTGGAWAIAYQTGMWAGGSVFHVRERRELWQSRSSDRRGETGLKLVLLVIAPLCVAGIILLGGRFVLYVMPPVTVVIQYLIFVGVVHHRFYDIEVRAARTGELAAEAAAQERLALLGELSATLAHEIRNPLTGMRSLTQRLASSGLDEDRRVRYTGVILGEIDRLERIVDNLLDLAKRRPPQDGRSGSTSLDPLFDDLALLMDSRLKRAQGTLHRDGGGITVAAPRDALAQALLNLLINASAHSPPGGTIRLEAVDADGAIEIRVSDSGPGVPAAERQHIFEPFRSHGLGAGLGLAVVRRLARENNWDTGVTDAAGGGARFFLRVPRRAADRVDPPAGSGLPLRAQHQDADSQGNSEGTP
ncbi:MAG TPA: HAMP domain-containing sensor histidine kinase [Longimicrobiales bacterium]|nr:HAMP domain-containing sensor histidine kinase [Longimicrobiales bacterium]